MAGIALTLLLTLGIAAVKLVVSWVLLPNEIIGVIGIIGAVASGALKLAFGVSVVCALGVAIALVPIVLPIVALGALTIAVVS